MMRNAILPVLLFSTLSLQAQIRNNEVYEVTEMDQSNVRNEIRIPNIEGFQTLKCDFHIHTVFSDGNVWPDVRITEAWQQGLDAIALTDHIEYRPHKKVLKGDLNESCRIAKAKADQMGFILIKGIEITRDKPLGHLNALFIKDALPMDVKDPLEAINVAHDQGAFIMWNHPGWPDDKSTLYPIHEKLIAEKKINGIEVYNYTEYYPIAFDWCRDKQLPMMGNSDIHGPITLTYGTSPRPLTLVFATERSEQGIKEALFAGRSVAYFNGKLAGKAELLSSLVLASLKIKMINEKERLVEITNISDIPFNIVCNQKLLIIPAGKTISTQLPQSAQASVTNCFTGSNECLKLALPR
ncbi:MAG: phosphotransferase [Tannerellaceae bacterium]